VLLPLFVGQQARAEMPQNMANLKVNLESVV